MGSSHPVRPPTSRALTSAIDTIRPYLADAKVLDLYSGQGRFGLALLGEGADHVTFVEKHSKTARELAESLGGFRDRSDLRNQDAMKFLVQAAKEGASFSIIIADPPFSFWNPKFCEQLCEAVSKVAGSGAIFLVRCPKRMVFSPEFPGFGLFKSSVFGDSRLLYLRYDEN